MNDRGIVQEGIGEAALDVTQDVISDPDGYLRASRVAGCEEQLKQW